MKISQLLAAMLALATGALAQNAPATPPVEPAKLALAREVIQAMHADKMFDGMAAQMKQMSGQMVAGALPGDATPEQRRKFEKFQGEAMDLSMEAAKGLVAQMDQIYAEVYSEAELRAIKTFFLSPEGQSMLAKQPQIMQHMMPLIQQMQRDLMPKIRTLAEEARMEESGTAAKPAEPAATK